jgi:hypothetical protein
MTVLAYGAEKVREIEHALGGTPPKGVLKESTAFLKRYLAERAKQRQATHAEASRRAERWRELLFSDLSKDDPRLKKLRAERQAAVKRLKRPKLESPKRPRIEPRIGSDVVVTGPPYFWWSSQTCQTGFAQTDNSAGSCSLFTYSHGKGYCEAYAFFTLWLFVPEDNPVQRISALVDYSDVWFDSAEFYVGHNDMTTSILVYGGNGEGLVHRADLSPSWSDGASWLDEHGNAPQGEAGRIAIETFFPATGNEGYYVQFLFDASVYADSGAFGETWSSLSIQCTVPMVVFGSLA